MKKLVSWFLISSLTFQLTGCYTFSEVELNNGSNFIVKQIEDNDIKIKLRNGEEIFSEAYYHTFNENSSEIIIGRGSIYYPNKNKSEMFGGKILKSEIDSMRFDKNFAFIWLNNKDRVVIEKNNIFELSPDSAQGFILTDNGRLNIIPFESIQLIEVKEYNSTLTVLTIVGAIVLTIGIIVLATFSGNHWSLLGSGSF